MEEDSEVYCFCPECGRRMDLCLCDYDEDDYYDDEDYWEEYWQDFFDEED